MIDKFISISEAAKLCGVSRVTINKWRAQGKLPSERTEWRVFVRESDVLALKKLREVPQIAPGESNE